MARVILMLVGALALTFTHEQHGRRRPVRVWNQTNLKGGVFKRQAGRI